MLSALDSPRSDISRLIALFALDKFRALVSFSSMDFFRLRWKWSEIRQNQQKTNIFMGNQGYLENLTTKDPENRIFNY